MHDLKARNIKVETNKDILEIELNSNLKRRRNECSSKLESMTFEENRELQSKRDELRALQTTISTLTRKLKCIFNALCNFMDILCMRIDLDEEYEDITHQKDEKTSTLDRAKANFTENNRSMELQKQKNDKFLAKKSLITKKKDEALLRIRDLGALPEEAFEKYQDVPNKSVIS